MEDLATEILANLVGFVVTLVVGSLMLLGLSLFFVLKQLAKM